MRASRPRQRSREGWYAAPHATLGPHAAPLHCHLRDARAAAPRGPTPPAPVGPPQRCPPRRTWRTCASSRSAARTPRRTGRSTATQLIFQSRPPRGGVRSDLPPAARRRRAAARRHACPCRAARGATTCSYFLPGDQRGHLRVDARGRRRVPAAPRSQPGLRLGALPTTTSIAPTPTASSARRLTDHARLRRRGDGVRQGRLDRLHVGARRRHRALPHGRRRQERPAAHERRRLRRRRVLQRRLHEDRLARVAAEAGQGARRLQAACSRRTWCGRPSSSSTSPTPTAATRSRSRTSTRRRSAPRSSRRAAHHLLVELRRSARARVRPVGDRRRRHAPRADHVRARLRRLPDVLARRQAARVLVEPRDGAGRARHQRVRRRLELERSRRRAARRAARADRDARRRPLARRSRRARGAASAPPASTRRARTSRSASRRSASSPRATPAATARRSRCAPASRSSRRPRCKIGGAAVPRDAFEPAGLLRQRARRRARSCSPATASSTRQLGIDDYAGLDVSGKIVVVRRFVPDHAALVDARAAAARRRPAPEGVDRARARRARAARRRSARAPEGRARRLEAARRGRRCRRRARAATATPASRSCWSSARRWRR